MNFDAKKTYLAYDGDEVVLWYNETPTGRPVPLIRATTYRQLNDGAIKLLGKDEWTNHMSEMIDKNPGNDCYIFAAANLYMRGLLNLWNDKSKEVKTAGSEWGDSILKGLSEAVDYLSDTFNKDSGKPKTSEKDLETINKMPMRTIHSAFDEMDSEAQLEAPQSKAQSIKAQPYESVNGPAHYDGTKCMDEMIALYGREAVRNFCICNAYKYRYRAGRKPDSSEAQDIAKAKWYEDYVIENKL